MVLTRRATLLLLVAAPAIAAATWAPLLRPVSFAYILLVLALFGIDWRRAEGVNTFEVWREHDTRLSLGADNSVFLFVRNRQLRPVSFVIRDEPPEAFVVDRLVHAGEAAPRDAWTGRYSVHPLQRGDYRFGNLTLRWLGPLGLVRRQGTVPAAEAVRVYPNLLDVRRYDLLLRNNRLQELGLRHARLVGQGTEFERLREYRPDDEYRRIDWKATARRHRPITVEYQTERSQTIVALLDTGRMMQSPVAQMAKLDYAVNAVLLLAYVATGMGDKIGMMTFATDVDHFLAPRQGRGQFYRMLERLYAVRARPVEPDYGFALNYLAHKQRRRALIVLFTDLSGGSSVQTLVEHVTLLARKSLPLVVTISDPGIHDLARLKPDDSGSVYRRFAAEQMLQERQLILESLRRQGVHTLDVPANELSLAVISRYLELKRLLRL